jgi:hypothetical protein
MSGAIQRANREVTTTTLVDVVYSTVVSELLAIYKRPYSGISNTANTSADVLREPVYVPIRDPHSKR